jgi:hypothetical protein
MKKSLLCIVVLIAGLSCLGINSYAQDEKKDTVSAGIYITSIHDIDFKQKEYTVTFWIWLKYKNKNFDFY